MVNPAKRHLIIGCLVLIAFVGAACNPTPTATPVPTRVPPTAVQTQAATTAPTTAAATTAATPAATLVATTAATTAATKAAATVQAPVLATTAAPTKAATTAAVMLATTAAPTKAATTSAAATAAITVAVTQMATNVATVSATAAATLAATPAATTAATVAATLAPTMAATSSVISTGGPLTVGYILVGPKEDKGWSEAHYRASQYVEKNVPGVKSIIVDKLNPADQPNVTLAQVVDNMKAEGAKLIITTSDAFQVDTTDVAKKNPDITFINVSGDAVLKKEASPNLGNIMSRMEYMKMVGGCAAALATQTKSIGYLGPLINEETRRLASSAFLGARYCYEKYRKGTPADLKFEVKWIGFWFNIPGVTLDPTEVTNSFYNGGADVVMSGIDTTEAIVIAKQRADKGEKVWAVPYDYRAACELGPKVCLGVPYFNWGPAYVKLIKDFKAGQWKQSWDWNGPDWKDINNQDTSAVGFIYGDALTADQKASLDSFIKDIGSGTVNLFTGPLNYQSGKPFLAAGKTATDSEIWYLPELLEGMKGDSQAKK